MKDQYTVVLVDDEEQVRVRVSKIINQTDAFKVVGIASNGQDAETESIQYIIDGQQSMTVFKDVRILVEDAYTMAVDILEGNQVNTTGTYDNGEIDVPSKQTDVITVTQGNVKEKIFDSGYYDIADFDNTDSLD